MAFTGKSSMFRFSWIVGFPLLGVFCLPMFRFSLGVLIPEIMSEFSLGEFEAGAVISTYLAVIAMVMALGGYASDKLGRKVVMGSGTAVMAFGILLFGLSTTFRLLVTSLVIVGIGVGVYLPTLYAYVGEVLPSRRGFLAGITHSAYAFGGFLGPSISGFLAEGHGWRIPVLAFGVLGSISSAAVWSIPYSKRRPEDRRKIPIKSILVNRELVIITTALAIYNMGFVSSTVWMPKFLVELEGFTIAGSGLALGLFSLSGGIGAIVLGWFSDRLGRREVAAIASMAAASMAFIYFLSGGYSYAARMAFSAVLGFVSYAYWNLSVAAAQDLTDPSVFGSVTGIVQNIAFVATAVGPIFSGSLIAIMGLSYALALSVCVPFLVYGLVFTLLSVRRLKRI